MLALLFHESGVGALLNPDFGQLKPINKPHTIIMLLLTEYLICQITALVT
jgi:hypothetical protein